LTAWVTGEIVFAFSEKTVLRSISRLGAQGIARKPACPVSTQVSIFRDCNNSFRYQRTSWHIQLVLEHGSLRLMAMSAARDNVVSEFANCDGWSNSAPMSAISALRH
jgi:hypothetical protein